MKFYQTFLFVGIMMLACSVGMANASPPKTTPLFTETIPAINSDIMTAAPVNIVYAQNENILCSTVNSVDAIHSKAVILPAPKVTQLSVFIHYNEITNQSIKKIEPRARSSDILNQNKRC